MAPTLGPKAVRIVPLGGLGQIGMNCLAIEQDDGILVVDCGTSFPHDDLGVDVIHPDFGWLKARAADVKGLVLTHGHEDHIGAVPYLLDDLDVPVFGPPHALALVRRRLAEHGYAPGDVQLLETRERAAREIGPFRVESLRVSHSIVDATALAIDTRAGTMVHTGDFNFDEGAAGEAASDEGRLEALGDRGVALLMSDSTNVDAAERAGSETRVADALGAIVASARRRVFVAVFASNVQRLRALGEIALRNERKLCLLGRSLVTQADIAHELGHLRWPSHLRVAPEQLRELPADRVLIVAGGSQAEPHSAMCRLARGAHNHIEVESGDTVVLSSRIIPGNERPVIEMICDLLRLGAEVVTRHTHPEVHTSGHAGRSEQVRMMELVRPRSFLPVHGTLRHLLRHAALARELGIDDVLVVENGTSVRLDEGGLHLDESFEQGMVHVALGGERLERETLGRRAELGRAGVLNVFLAVNGSRSIVAGPRVSALGVPVLDQDDGALRGVARGVARSYESLRTHYTPQDPALAEELRRAARRSAYEVCGSRPVVEVSLLVVDR